MKRSILTLVTVFSLAALPATIHAQACPQGLQPLACEGGTQCQPPGSKCCGTIACSPRQVCLECNGVEMCRPPGFQCCGNDICGPGQTCMHCGAQRSCQPEGQKCPQPGE